MRVSVLCIGDELLKGATVNTNLADIGKELLAAGIVPVQEMTVPDEEISIKKSLCYLHNCSDLIITSGGLGPTCDDISKEVVSNFFNTKLIENPKFVESIKLFWSKRKPGSLPDRVLRQALVPEGAEILPNEVGTAPGIWMQTGDSKYLAMLPGPPHELRCMLKKYLLPKIENINENRLITAKLFLAGVPESIAEDRSAPILDKIGNVSVAYCASPEGVKIYLTSTDSSSLLTADTMLREEFAENVLSLESSSLPEEVMHLLKEQKLLLSTAESCTGGMIAAAITDLAGSSEVFHGSLVVYSNEWKHNMLGVSSEVLERYGAVSEECVREMVDNLCKKFSVKAGIAVSGIAGPGGGTDEKPVGLVYIGVKVRNKSIVKKYNFPGKRYIVRKRTLYTALNILRKLLKNYS